MRMSHCICVWFFLLSLGCAPKDQEPKAKIEGPRSETKSTPESEPKAPEVSTKEVEKDTPVATPEPLPVPPVPKVESTVLFMVTYDAEILPLSCFDAKENTFLKEKDCLSLVAVGDSVRLSNGKYFKIKGKTEFECGPAAELSPGFSLEKNPEDETNFEMIAFWPGVAADRFIPFPQANDDLGAQNLSKDEQDSLRKAVQNKAPNLTSTLLLKQAVSLDLNNDGVMDKLYSVVVPAEKEEGEEEMFGAYGFSGVFFADGKTPETIQLVQTSDYEYFIMDGYMDLDGDKAPEIWLSLNYNEGGSDSVVQWQNGKFESLGLWGCGE